MPKDKDMPKEQRRDKSEGEMTVREAGRKGGQVGGQKGGEAVKEKYGPEHFSEIGSQSHKNDPGRQSEGEGHRSND